MRFTHLLILLFAVAESGHSGEVTLSLDQCRVVNNQQDNSQPSKLLLEFTIPQNLIGAEVFYAKFTMPFALPNNSPDSIFELRFYPLVTEAPEGDIDYQALDAITDSMGVGASICQSEDSTWFEVHITEYVREVTEGIRRNYGLVGTVDLLGERNIVVPENLAGIIRNHASVRIIYK